MTPNDIREKLADAEFKGSSTTALICLAHIGLLVYEELAQLVVEVRRTNG